MGLPSSPVDICNMALDQLKQPPIAAIEPPEDIEAARICSRHYDHARQSVLRAFVWNFAKKRAVINRTGAPAFDYADQYELPNDFIRFLSIKGMYDADKDIQQRTLLIDAAGAASIQLRYIADITDVTKWDAGFRELVVLTLAKNIAYAITGQKAAVERMDSLLVKALPDAVSVDGQEVPPKRIQRSKVVAARRSVGSTNVASQYTVLD